ncbi:hypothetical protein [Pelagerythrobacter sp.]|uniref:hypothetical protein n=1 Tax=Pelagerythrobacter sp. TaxID=2800702 RepID=UPI0035B2B60B
MKRSALPVLLALAALVPAAHAQTAPDGAAAEPTVQQKTALRCSVAFALVAQGQARGDPAMAEWPPLGERGREFFVRSSAQMMDETGMTREEVAALLANEITALGEPGALAEVMPPCLLLLDASGL